MTNMKQQNTYGVIYSQVNNYFITKYKKRDSSILQQIAGDKINPEVVTLHNTSH